MLTTGGLPVRMRKLRVSAARAWSSWEMATSRIFIDDEMLKKAEEDKWVLQFARVEW